MKRKRPSISLLLDTNVWRYIADEQAGAEIARVADRAAVRVCIAPAVAYEAVRTGDPGLRASLVKLMTQGAWHRLMPEAYDEAAELLEEIRRLRPTWLRAQRDEEALAWRKQVEADWRIRVGGFWDRARNDTDAEALRLQTMDGDAMSAARAEALRRRSEVLNYAWSAPPEHLRNLRVKLEPAPPGWDGAEIEPWRVDGSTSARHSITAAITGDHPYADWLAPNIDLSTTIANEESWNHFWFHDVRAEHMPRCWIRWATEFLQRFRKVTDGTPVDCQLATYLVDVDAFATADKALVDILKRCAPEAPCHMATVFRLGGGNGCAAELVSLMKTLRSHVSESAQA